MKYWLRSGNLKPLSNEIFSVYSNENPCKIVSLDIIVNGLLLGWLSSPRYTDVDQLWTPFGKSGFDHGRFFPIQIRSICLLFRKKQRNIGKRCSPISREVTARLKSIRAQTWSANRGFEPIQTPNRFLTDNPVWALISCLCWHSISQNDRQSGLTCLLMDWF